MSDHPQLAMHEFRRNARSHSVGVFFVINENVMPLGW